MRIWRLEGDRGIDDLAMREAPEPAPGPGEVLVRMTANSINYRDLSTIRAPAARGIRLPFTPNSDGCGVVEAVGAEVDGIAAGDRVTTTFFADWEDGGCTAAAMAGALGGARAGVLAERVALRAGGVLAAPGHLSDEEAACLPCAGLTAWNALFEQAEIRSGDSVLLLGSGGVSVFALQFAHAVGARAAALTASPEKARILRDLGAEETIDYRRREGWAARVRDWAGGGGVDAVVETGGPGTLAQSLDAVRVGGTVVLIGTLTGGLVDPMPVMRKSIRLQGVYVGNRRMFRDMNRFLAERGLRPRIDRTVPFERAPEAYRAMAARGHLGKIAIRMRD